MTTQRVLLLLVLAAGVVLFVAHLPAESQEKNGPVVTQSGSKALCVEPEPGVTPGQELVEEEQETTER